MNMIYRIVWNASAHAWVVASEFAKGRKKAGKAASAQLRLTAATVAVMVVGVLGMSIALPANAAVLLQKSAAGTTCERDADDGNPTWSVQGACVKFNGGTGASKTISPGTNVVIYGTSSVNEPEDSIAVGGYLDVWNVASFHNGVDMSGTKITGLAPGTVNATSLDAVNGSQLFDTNGRVTTAEGNIATNATNVTNNTTSITNLGGRVTTAEGNIATNTTSITHLGDRVTTTEGDITTIQGNVTDLSTQITNGEVGLVKQDAHTHAITVASATGGTSVDFTGTDGVRTLSGVKGATLAEGSSEAVNGSQLFDTNGRVTTAEGNIATNATNITNNTTSITHLGGRVTTAEGNITTIQGDVSNITNQITNGEVGLVQQAASGANLTVGKGTGGVAVDFADKDGETRTLKNVTAGVDDTDAVNVSQLKATGLVDAAGNTVSAVTYDSAAKDSITLGGAGATTPVKLKNVANGTDDTDAVNVSQLKATGLVNSDGSVQKAVMFNGPNGEANVAGQKIINVANGSIAAGSLDAVNGGQIATLSDNLQNQISGLGNQVTNIDNRVTNIQANGGGGSSMPNVDGNANGSSNNANAGSTAGVTVGYNANAAGDNASVVGQNATALGSYGTAVGNDSYAVGANDTALGGNAKVNADGSVAIGAHAQVSAAATNAVAVGANAQVNAASGTAIGQGASVTSAATGSVALGQGSVADRANSVSVGTVGGERQITNVAAGTQATDAVNVGQLNQGLNQASDWAKSYTDQQVNQVNNHANAGVASAMAMANLPQAYQPNQSSAGVALGSFRGEQSMAVGVSTISESGRYIFKASATSNTRGDLGVGVGAGMVW